MKQKLIVLLTLLSLTYYDAQANWLTDAWHAVTSFVTAPFNPVWGKYEEKILNGNPLLTTFNRTGKNKNRTTEKC